MARSVSGALSTLKGHVSDGGAAAKDAAAEPDDTIAYCRGRLTVYKYPRKVQIAADLPERQNGKILKRELRPE
jgi:long-chain acyl-CoA synthetase